MIDPPSSASRAFNADAGDDDPLVFIPVPSARNRRDGWTPERQRQFISALAAMGTVGYAARAVGMSAVSAYKLLKRPGAESFADAWDRAISAGRARMFDYAIERALNGVTSIRIGAGAALDVSHGPDRRMMMAVLREPPRKARPRPHVTL